MWLKVSGFMVIGLVSGLALANHLSWPVFALTQGSSWWLTHLIAKMDSSIMGNWQYISSPFPSFWPLSRFPSFFYFQLTPFPLSDQSLSRVRLFVTPWIAARQASLSITNPQSSLRHIHRVSDAIQPSHPLLSPSPPAPTPSQPQGLFHWINSSHEVAKVLEFQL